MDLTDRIAFLNARLRQVELELKSADARLAAAPSWYRAGVRNPRLTPADRATFNELERLRARVGNLRAGLQKVRDLLGDAERDLRPWKRCQLQALEWINDAVTWRDLARNFVLDPALPSGRPPKSGPARVGRASDDPRRMQKVFQAILRYRDSEPGRKLRRLEDLVEQSIIAEDLFHSLIYTGCTLLPPIRPGIPTPVVPVLLPVRLETRFDPPAAPGQSWHMRVRIVPDDAIFDRLDSLASSEELGLVVKLWRQTNGQLDTAAGRAAWQDFVSRVGGARAAWLVREFPMVTGPDGQPTITQPAQIRTQPFAASMRGLPARIEVWLGRNGGAPQRAVTLNVDRVSIGQMDLPDLSAGQRRWWNSYVEAERIGLAADIDIGARADDIDVVFVTGLSDETPDDWFRHHCDRGDVGLLKPGTPTNTVDGGRAAPLDGDASHWLRVARGQGATDPGARTLAQILTGSVANARTLLGGDTDVETVGRMLVQGLWYPLWGHPAKDLFGLGAETHLAGLWAARALRPEGPFPTLRIGTQPYGLLPVTVLDRWQPAANDPPFEAAALNSLRAGRDAWAAEAENAGTVQDADTERLLDLLGRTPTSDAYAYRWFVPLDLLLMLWWMTGDTPSWNGLLAAYEGWMDNIRAICANVDPQIRLVAFGWPQDLEIPLVQPDNLTEEQFRELLKRLGEPTFNVSAVFKEGGWKILTRGVEPNSLLVRLLMFAHWVAAAEIGREQQNIKGPVAPELFWDPATGERLQRDAAAVGPIVPGGPAFILQRNLQEACAVLSGLPIDEIERAMRAVLDTASHRLDPWLTGYALRRLVDEGAGWPRRLGIFGWVDAPRPGHPGPTAGGLLHAPSHAQAYTAMVLRDRAISDPEVPSKWTMNLDSATVRMADWLGAGVRAGGHLAEVLGAEVERVVGTPAQIQALREAFPIRAEYAGRRICDGVAVLAADPAALGLPAATLAALSDLRRALDAYGDLLVAQAVHHVVSGRGEIAGASMDAAAGLAQPPTLEVLHTPRSGRSVATTAIFCLPDAPAPVIGVDTSPTRIADPSFAAFIETMTGPAAGLAWTWEFDPPAGAIVAVTLGDIGLSPCDAAVLPAETLARIVAAAAGAGATVRATSRGPATHARARALIGVSGREPAEPKHLVTSTRPSGQSVADELRLRLVALETFAVQIRDAISAAVSAAPADQTLALHRALRWGITSVEQAEDTVEVRLAGAANALSDRLRALPPAADRVSLSSTEVARLIAELAAADGRWPVLGRIDVAALAPQLVLDVRPAGAATNPVDDNWLAVVSTVRPTMARVEAIQLEGVIASGSAPFYVWTNRPGDAWQQTGTRDPDTGRMPDSHLIAAYGPPGVLDGVAAGAGVRAIGLLDSWSEVVPEVEHTTTAGFGFNAPAARAPQALLIGVPPAANGILAPDDLASMVLEARRLARVRMARPVDLDQLSAATPAMLLPADTPAGVDLRRSP